MRGTSDDGPVLEAEHAAVGWTGHGRQGATRPHRPAVQRSALVRATVADREDALRGSVQEHRPVVELHVGSPVSTKLIESHRGRPRVLHDATSVPDATW